MNLLVAQVFLFRAIHDEAGCHPLRRVYVPFSSDAGCDPASLLMFLISKQRGRVTPSSSWVLFIFM
jgi:hypothetical protein